MLAMARSTMARVKNDPREQRRQGVQDFRKVARDVTHISRMQLDDELLARLGQKADAPATDVRPDFVFYTGCNVLKTPHIALLALDVMDTIGATYQVMGGPSHCCGVVQIRTGDVETSGRFAQATMDKLASSKSGQVVSWCPSCHIQFTETTLPTVEKVRGAKPFEMTPFMLYLRAQSRSAAPASAPSACRCASRCTSIPACMASWRRPRIFYARCRGSNWSISSSPPSAP